MVPLDGSDLLSTPQLPFRITILIQALPNLHSKEVAHATRQINRKLTPGFTDNFDERSHFVYEGGNCSKIFFIIAIAVLGFNTSSCTQYNTFPDEISKKVNTPEALKKTIDSKDSSFVIIDVRSEPEYKIGHIPTAINIPDGLIEKVANSPSRDKYIVVYCSQGGIAPEVGKK